MTRAHGRYHARPYTAVMYTGVYHPCTGPLPAHSRVRTVYTAVHGPCTRAVNTPGYRVHDRVGIPYTRPWTHHVDGPCTPVYTVRTRRERSHIHGTYTAVHTGRKQGRLHGRKHRLAHLPTGVPTRWQAADSKTDVRCSPSTSGNCSFKSAEQ